MNDTPSLDELVAAYAELEQRVHAAIRMMSSHLCAACTTPCCEPHHCSQVPESPWLRRVAAHVGETCDAKAGDIDFLGDTGCRLAAGRPVQCTWYICDHLAMTIRDPIDRFTYQVLSSLLGFVVRSLTRDGDLIDVECLDELTTAQSRRVARRIRTAEDCLARVVSLLESRDQQRPVQDTMADMLLIARVFPFAANAVRFDGETPSLSRAGRRGLSKSK